MLVNVVSKQTTRNIHMWLIHFVDNVFNQISCQSKWRDACGCAQRLSNMKNCKFRKKDQWFSLCTQAFFTLWSTYHKNLYDIHFREIVRSCNSNDVCSWQKSILETSRGQRLEKCGKNSPPTPRNGAAVRVLFECNKDVVYKTCYKNFCNSGCLLDGKRYSGADNLALNEHERAARFTRYLQICCNYHHGKDTTYLERTFFKSLDKKMPHKRRIQVCGYFLFSDARLILAPIVY